MFRFLFWASRAYSNKMHFQILVLGAFKQLTGGIGLSGRAWVARKILMPPECEASPKQGWGFKLTGQGLP